MATKILLIGDSWIGDSPYIKSYIDLFTQHNIAFDLVYWNRNLADTAALPVNYIPYNHPTDNKYPNWKKLFKIHGFYRFCMKQIRENYYTHIVVFTIAHAVYFDSYLAKKFKGKFIFDIRDNSPMCHLPFFSHKMNHLIQQSDLTVISSEGFKRWLPSRLKGDYLISHNVGLSNLEYYMHKNQHLRSTAKLKVLTIGQIRDFIPNSHIIKGLANQPDFEMQFAGAGSGTADLQKFCDENRITNVFFSGRYKKENEDAIVASSDMINIYLSRNENSDTAMANRFYLSVMMRKPMIVNEGCFQAEQVKRYGLGVIVGENDDLKQVIKKYWEDFDSDLYNQNCVRFLNDVRKDILAFDKAILDFVYS